VNTNIQLTPISIDCTPLGADTQTTEDQQILCHYTHSPYSSINSARYIRKDYLPKLPTYNTRPIRPEDYTTTDSDYDHDHIGSDKEILEYLQSPEGQQYEIERFHFSLDKIINSINKVKTQQREITDRLISINHYSIALLIIIVLSWALYGGIVFAIQIIHTITSNNSIEDNEE
jgi:hypothetical protein